MSSYSKDTKKGHFALDFQLFRFTPPGLLGEIVRWDGLFELCRHGSRYSITTPELSFSTNSYVGNLGVRFGLFLGISEFCPDLRFDYGCVWFCRCGSYVFD